MNDSKKKKILIPILTELENNPDFINHLRNQNIGEVVLLFVVDREIHGEKPTLEVGEKLKRAEAIMASLKKSLWDKKIEEHIEWGKWIEKIENISKLEEVNMIMIISTKETQELLPTLKEKNLNIETFELKNNGPEKIADDIQ
jgi:hypothetical protein